jgi:hypothetical protein
MSDKLRQRARYLAECAAGQVLNDRPAHMLLIGIIEAAILTGMREALREEPDGEMITAIDITRDNTIATLWTAMAEARARGLE